MKECSANLAEKIYIRKEHLVCHTMCNHIVKIRFKKYSMIRPEVSIKYFKCIVKRFGNYAIAKEVVKLSKESKLALEKISGKELTPTAILMRNLKKGIYARMTYVQECTCMCNECLEEENRTLAIPECSTGPYTLEEFKGIISQIKKKEKIKEKIKEQEASYNKYGIRQIRMIYDRFFGCYNLKEKRAGIRPFTLKGPWTKDSANKLIHSYKTSTSIKNMSFFILIHKHSINPQQFILHNSTPVYYSVIIHKIDLKTKAELRQHIKNKLHKK